MENSPALLSLKSISISFVLLSLSGRGEDINVTAENVTVVVV